MTPRKPFTSQCTAKSKSTGERCKRRVEGGGVCKFHGGAAPQVAAHREVRLLVAQAQKDAGEGEPVFVSRDPAIALTSALSDSDVVVQKIKGLLENGEGLDGTHIEALGQWLDRVGRLSKLVIDAKLDERKARRDEATARMIGEAIRGVLAEMNLTPEQQRLIPIVVPRQLRLIAGEKA